MIDGHAFVPGTCIYFALFVFNIRVGAEHDPLSTILGVPRDCYTAAQLIYLLAFAASGKSRNVICHSIFVVAAIYSTWAVGVFAISCLLRLCHTIQDQFRRMLPAAGASLLQARYVRRLLLFRLHLSGCRTPRILVAVMTANHNPSGYRSKNGRDKEESS